MLLKDRFVRAWLVVIGVLLAANLTVGLLLPAARASAEPAKAQKAATRGGFGISGTPASLACSSDGRVVFASDGEDVFRSLNFGEPGSWEHVLK